MLMRGGTSKGAYFLAADLPAADRPAADRPAADRPAADPPATEAARDDLLLRLLGSPDPRQVDGIGGGHPLTSKVAVVSASPGPGADVDYLFLQVHVDEARVSAGQPCGNILAGVAPFAVERGLVAPAGDRTSVRIRMVNTGGLAVARIATPGGRADYAGDTVISGVPFPGAEVALTFADTEGSVCGRLLPTGGVRDDIDGTPVTCIDNGMPVVLVEASALGADGHESCAELEADAALRAKVERLRLRAGELMGLGDVGATTIPKVTLVAPPGAGGTLATRTFIPHRCHTSIGVLGAVSVASAVRLPGSTAAAVAGPPREDGRVRLEHPTGFFDTQVTVDAGGRLGPVAVVRTARKLFDGTTWPRPS
jgi:4-oxalomesaconate tautomerase